MPTKEEFMAFEAVRKQGNWNMFMEGRQAAAEAGFDFGTYTTILFNYSELAKKYLEPAPFRML